MARVTVEDCVEKMPNRFELVLAASQRSRDISAGASIHVDRDRDKNPVVALREIADGHVDPETMRAALIQGLQKHVEMDEPEEEDLDVLGIEAESHMPGHDEAVYGQQMIDAGNLSEEEPEGEEATAVDGEDEEDDSVADLPVDFEDNEDSDED